MDCPHCHSTETSKRQRQTTLGYDVFRCQGCGRTFNERTGTPFNYLEVPNDIVFQALLYRVRYKLNYRDIAELFLLRGFVFTHETVCDWEARFGPIFMDELRAKRQVKPGKIWYVDETYVKVKGRWCYLYRAMDQAGKLVDSLLSEKRDMAAAKAFFARALEVAEGALEKVVTDGHTAYPRAIAEVLAPEVFHHSVGCVANPIEQDHRGIKQRCYPTLGFNHFEAAQRFCRLVDEVRDFLRPRQRMGQSITRAELRAHVLRRVDASYGLFALT